MDLKYPKEWQKLDNDYPLAPDKLEVKKEMSDYQLKIDGDYSFSTGNVKKLIADFDKETYMLYYQNMQLYLRLGLKIKKYMVY